MSRVPTGVELKIAHLEAISRTRALTDEESLTFERLLQRHGFPEPANLTVVNAPPRAPCRSADPRDEVQLAFFHGPLFDPAASGRRELELVA